MGEGVKWVNSKAKSAWPSKAKEGIHSLLIISAIPWRARFITHNGFLERSTPSLWMSPPFPFFSSHTVQHNTICYGISLWLVWVSCLVCVPPSSLCTPCSLLTEEHEKLQSPRLCASIALQQLCHCCAVASIFTKNSIHSIMKTSVKKINSIPVKTKTGPKMYY